MKNTPEITVVDEEQIEVYGARVHNLKDIDVTIPRNQLVVITGLSGSGKSSLAFDTIYAEGQRRYIESFSAYARQFLGKMERPDVDKIKGLAPVISIEQKTVNRSPRSTVGTITEIYDFMRLLFARAGDAYSYKTGEKMVRYTEEKILNLVMEHYDGKKIAVMSPLVRGRKGHYRELFESAAKKGYVKVRVDGEIQDIVSGMKLDRYKVHDIDLVIDRTAVTEEKKERIATSLKTAFKQGKGMLSVFNYDDDTVRHFSKNLMCPTTGIAYDDPAPNIFSFNSPYGACSSCNGLGIVDQPDLDKIIPNPKKSIKNGGIVPLGEYKNNALFKQIEYIALKFNFKTSEPVEKIPKKGLDAILYGHQDPNYSFKDEVVGIRRNIHINFKGAVNWIMDQTKGKAPKGLRRRAEQFIKKQPCPSCKGTRLKKESLHYKIDGKNISELAELDIVELQSFFEDLENRLSKKQNKIAKEVLKEIRSRIGFLLDVGLNYLTVNRSSRSLSGGEAQRIRLATQIGSKLVGVLYILDEPSIGLHQRDNQRLINALKELRDIGNSVIVVEHDKDMILEADHVIDFGPRAGVHGGKIIAQGKPEDLKSKNSLTTDYLLGRKKIDVPAKRRKGNGKQIDITGAAGNNLKNLNISIPLGMFICVTGVSGSGKSTLINETLYPFLSQYFYKSSKFPLDFKKITGHEHLDKVIDIDQSPIGRTPRSNPATYTGVFDDIRRLFSDLPEAKIRGYKPGRFSFNVKGGRCEDCGGAGMKTIEMNFLPDVHVNCETCRGKRYNRETLEVRYKGHSISDVLNMTIEKALPFFENIPAINQKIETLHRVGLGYLTLGQSSVTLSGGEAQRVKLASELAKTNTGNTFYILDEPTTGLHFEDIRILLEVLQSLVEKGNTILVIEHNMDIIKVADHIIDIGPEGGVSGGKLITQGTPEEVARHKTSHTAKFLKDEINL